MNSRSNILRPASVFFLPVDVLKSFCDLTLLPYLYDETVLECIVARYNDGVIYTWAGPILVAVNPFSSHPKLYSSSKIKNIYDSVKVGFDNQDPHIFTVAGLAHHRLVAQLGLVNQAILVSGESGAGKTESAKYLLTYLTEVELENLSVKEVNKGKQPQDVQRRILASNPVLEAFGNAATLRNHNSSRFGKLIRLQYSCHNLKGAEIDTYLLEKTRVTTQPANERNFHIFYQVLAAINNGIFSDFDNVDASSFAITPGYDKNTDKKDLSAFQETKDAFLAIGVSHKAQREIYQIIIALLHLGNVNFELDERKESWIVAKTDETIHSIAEASRLFGLRKDTLVEALTVKKIVVNASSKTTVYSKVCERKEQCEERRDALMQLVYAALFSHLVSIVNDNTSADAALWSSYLGILDVYGFETFDQNSLEQLCINYTNERLQQEFTSRYLASEMRILSEEGFLDFSFIYTDNSRCVSALDSPLSVFSILNEECQLRRAVDEDNTCQRVCKALQDTGIIHPPTTAHQNSGFVVRHYAGSVSYSSNGILHKNKDEVPREIVELLSRSENSLVASLNFGEEVNELSTAKDTPTRRSTRKITTLSKFKSSLDLLMKILKSCDLHYVRCLKPNMKNVSNFPDDPFLHGQLKSNGILETVKISQAGYPVRMLYDEFIRRYSFKNTHLPHFTSKERTFLTALEVLGDDGAGAPSVEKCRFGQTRIFLSESSLRNMEAARNSHRNKAALSLQKHVRRYATQKRYKRILQTIVILQQQWRTSLFRLRFLKLKKACLIIQKNTRTLLAVKHYRRVQQASIVIQKYARGWICRKKYRHILLDVKRIDGARPYSCMSFASTGYASISIAGSSLTDYSVSDAETLVAGDEPLQYWFAGCDSRIMRLLETEESGIETDTESLSGERLKTGRTPKVRSRRELSSLCRHIGVTCVSDEEVPDGNILFKRRSISTPLEAVFKPQTTGNLIEMSAGSQSKRLFPSDIIARNIRIQLQKKAAQSVTNRNQNELHDLRVATVKHFREVNNVLRGSRPSESLYLYLPNKIPLYFRDGIISYRQMPQVKIKFHTRHTCLPFSTELPYQERPQGLIDAVR